MNKKRIVMDSRGEEIFVADPSREMHTTHGFFTAKDLKKRSGSRIRTNTGAEFTVIDAAFSDLFRRLKRHAQVITPKDIGYIIAETGITKKSIVIDAGTGSGALACFLAAVAKRVTSYDNDDRSIAAGQENKKRLGLNNLAIKKADAYEPGAIKEKNADAVILDLPEPWKALDNAAGALRNGGWLVCYSPHITQALETSNAALEKGLIVKRTVELIRREWVLEGRKARPDFSGLGHTGFMTFLRKI